MTEGGKDRGEYPRSTNLVEGIMLFCGWTRLLWTRGGGRPWSRGVRDRVRVGGAGPGARELVSGGGPPARVLELMVDWIICTWVALRGFEVIWTVTVPEWVSWRWGRSAGMVGVGYGSRMGWFEHFGILWMGVGATWSFTTTINDALVTQHGAGVIYRASISVWRGGMLESWSGWVCRGYSIAEVERMVCVLSYRWPERDQQLELIIDPESQALWQVGSGRRRGIAVVARWLWERQVTVQVKYVNMYGEKCGVEGCEGCVEDSEAGGLMAGFREDKDSADSDSPGKSATERGGLFDFDIFCDM
ncbi:hypothetical protein P691DRAFT_780697 [Macrolepiota fuliginosa MF-IS2]|uniref:Uncharacterized protein n=1 Tax=Macrolepiota fuliginosa MF-IS2 TaxID=1400762 RepID=A0A9P5XC21_9AGAR|nr:hypothetical protein P691DRAFT_780697 [Macrolepiota fuliginosa MF-IS2]